MVREKVTAFGEPGNVPLRLVQDLIESSAYWADHPQSTTSASGWADRVVRGPHGWEVQFGANYFLVEKAVLLSQRAILEELDHSQTLNQPIDRKLLYRRLITCVRKSVANWNHDPFDYYKGGASPELKRQVYYTADSMLPRAPEGKVSLIGPDTKRYGSTPPSMDVWKGHMKFGANAIKVDAFIERICQSAGLTTVE